MSENRFKHPNCECSDMDPGKEEEETLALSQAVSMTMSFNSDVIDICQRQMYTSMLISMVSSMDALGWDDDTIRKEISLGLDVVLLQRKITNAPQPEATVN